MEETTSKTYFFDRGNDNLLTALIPMLTQRNIDPNVIIPLLNQGGMGGFGGGWGIMWLFFILFAFWGRGGNFLGGGNGSDGTAFLANQLNNDAGRALLEQLAQGNGAAIGQLSTNLGIASNRVSDAFCSIQSILQQIGGQIGLTAAQTQNAIERGDASLAAQFAQCCCENKLLVTEQGYQAQIRTLEQTNQLGQQADRNFSALSSEIAGLKASMIDQFCGLEKRDMQSKIDSQAETITQLRGQIDNANQTSQIIGYVNSVVSPIQKDIDAVKCKLPETVSVPYPQLSVVNNTPNPTNGFTGFGGCGAGFGLGLGNTFGWGWNNGSIWG